MGYALLCNTPDPFVEKLFADEEVARQRAFFAARPELAATPLRALPALARALGLGGLYAKDETTRFGLNAFKAVGALFAVSTLRERGQIAPGDVLACASEGNHGRAVARAARDAGCQARVYLSDTVARPRIEAIRSEGAAVVSVHGHYDEAVRVMARESADHGWTVISDTSWDGYDEIPRLIMLGYTRLMDEIAAQWPASRAPDAIFVQAGVGGLLAAVAASVPTHFPARPSIVGVEPASAASVQLSVRNGRPTTLPGPFETIMGGLRCGEVSRLAFDTLRTGVDGYVAIEDDWAFSAMKLLAQPADGDPAILAGASGAASLAGLLATLQGPDLDDVRRRLAFSEQSHIVVIVSEGVTDPAAMEEALSRGRDRASHMRTPGGGIEGTFRP